MFERNYNIIRIIIQLLVIYTIIDAYPCHLPQRQRSAWDTYKLNQAKVIKNDVSDFSNVINGIVKYLNDWGFHEIAHITKNDKFNEENFKKINEKIINLHNNFTEISSEIAQLNNDNDATAINKKSEGLVNNLDDLNRKLDNKTREGLHLLSSYQSSEDIVNIFDKLSTEILLISKTIEEKEQNVILNDCIKAIKRKDFASADLKLNLIKSDSRIIQIVEEVYSHNANNYYFLINFTDVITNVSKNWIILKELNNQLQNHRGVTLSKIVSLVNTLNTKIINKLNDDSDMKKEAISLLHNLKCDLKTIEIMQLTDFLENKKIENCNLNFLWNVFLLDDELAFSILYQTYLDTNELHDIMTRFQTVFDQLVSSSIDDSNNIFKLSHLIRKFLLKIDRLKYLDSYLGAFKTDKIDQLIRSILFAEEVCIHKYSFDGYLRIPSVSLGINHSRYVPYITTDLEYFSELIWKLIPVHDNQYYIGNSALEDAYLTINDNNTFKSFGHQVHMSSTKSNGSLWMIEIMEGYCLIKNVINNEYMYSSISTDEDLYATKPFGDISDEYKWVITNYNDVDLY